MSNEKENVTFAFRVKAWDIDTYKQREEFVADLKSVPGLKVSSVCESAAFGGMEEHLITVIATVANILTIADFLFKYFRNTKRKRKVARDSIVAYVPRNGEIVLNTLTRQEIVKVIETSSSYALVVSSHRRIRKKTKRPNKTKRSAKVPQVRVSSFLKAQPR